MIPPDLSDVLILLGCAVLIYGISLVSLSGAIIVCGLVVIALGIGLARRAAHGRPGR